ncbi:hypothetical protein ACFQY8_07255 [Alloscardovia venturai]|uniref:Uncharacterized protein n=1 Tax=Alloscardovia venturai TaxID=1769421 RepID=A0ABW2Y5K6_9BIFI
MRDTVLIPAFIIAVYAAVHFRSFSRNSVIVGRVSARSRAYLACVGSLPMIFLSAGGYVLGMSPLIIHVALHASWFHFNVLSGCAALVEVFMLSVIGIVVAVLFPSRWSLIVAPATVLVVAFLPVEINNTILSNSGHSSLTFAPVWMENLPGLGYSTSVSMNISRIAIALFTSITLIMFALHFLEGKYTQGRMFNSVLLTSLFCTVVLIGWSIAVPSTIFKAENVTIQCKNTSDNIVLCVHPADMTVRQEIMEITREVFAVAPQSGSVLVVEGMNSSSTVQFKRKIYNSEQVLTMWGTAVSTLTGNETKAEIKKTLYDDLINQIVVPISACSSKNQDSANVMNTIQTGIRLRFGLAANSGMIDENTGREVIDEESQWLAHITDQNFTQWYMQHRQDIQSCTITQVE